MSDTASPTLVRKVVLALRQRDCDLRPALSAAQRSLAQEVQAAGAIQPLLGREELRDLLELFLIHGRTMKPALEAALTRWRAHLLAVADAPAALVTALAVHCFNNEYVFTESAAETMLVDPLRGRLNAGEGTVTEAAVFAAYRPLAGEAWATRFAESLEVLHRIHIEEPAREAVLRRSVARVTPVADAISLDVQRQYEQNPYPRWQRLDVDRARMPARTGAPGRRVLIAGCGTGKQPLTMALAAPEDSFWALDLSAASLAYAMRKAEEAGVGNITFVQGDILELAKFDATFDAVVSSGVLHHLDDPARGLAALGTALAPGGSLKIEVYTQSVAVDAGIALRREHGLPPTPEGIRGFRELVCALPGGHPAARLTAFEDFHATSECRDLVFHVKEHRYTLPRLADMCATAGFRIARVYAGAAPLARFAARFPDADPDTDLAAWSALEGEEPEILAPMYRVSLARI